MTKQTNKLNSQVRFGLNIDEELKLLKCSLLKLNNSNKLLELRMLQRCQLSQTLSKDGNENMYSKDNITKRRKLKIILMQFKSIETFMSHYQFDINNKLMKENYLKTHIRLAYLLKKDIQEDKQEIIFLLLEDWFNRIIIKDI
ncbi:unnamed protein product [Paramecium sonneborni]|uniref:Uncharacterized protein n=1 Tax=Paramecium sonneborni TaxID=65129 RepID=A0A8S1QXB6_9CILI|nr:unnamed protein product [Paramecium sonneborni]CAD8119112.1 unnamed protein product [Paramecium sonneborni]